MVSLGRGIPTALGVAKEKQFERVFGHGDSFYGSCSGKTGTPGANQDADIGAVHEAIPIKVTF
jgi:hypothetical protein